MLLERNINKGTFSWFILNYIHILLHLFILKMFCLGKLQIKIKKLYKKHIV